MTIDLRGLKTSYWAIVAAIGIAVGASPAVARDGAGKSGEHQAKNREAAKDTASENSAADPQIAADVTVSKDDEHAAPLNVQNINGKERVSFLNTSFAAADAPFVRGWYASHRGAWQTADIITDAWATASLPSALNWLGITDNPPAADAAKDKDGDDDKDDDDDTSAQGDNDMDDDEPSTSDVEAATKLAHSGPTQIATDAKFLPLGVYALAPQDQDDATALLQLAVTADGVVRGTYYDLLSEEAHAIQGAIDKEDERVAFTIGQDGTTIFETKLADLTNPEGEVSLHFADGEASDWTLARFETLGSEATSKD